MSGKKIFVPISLDEDTVDDALSNLYDGVTVHSFSKSREYVYFLTELLLNKLVDWMKKYHLEVSAKKNFWEKQLFVWVNSFVLNSVEKIDAWEQLRNRHRNDSLYSKAHSFASGYFLDKFDDQDMFSDIEYNGYAYVFFAENYFDVKIEYVENQDMIQGSNLLKKSKSERVDMILERLHRIKERSVKNNLLGAYYQFFKRNKERVKIGYYLTYVFPDSALKWCWYSKARMMPIDLPGCGVCNKKIDYQARGELRRFLIKGLKVGSWEYMLADFVSNVIPRYYIEGFRDVYRIAYSEYKKYTSLKLLYSQTGYWNNSVFKTFALIAQQNGVIIVGHQHGGNYEVIEDVIRFEKAFVNCYFFWGTAAVTNRLLDEAYSAPSFKLRASEMSSGICEQLKVLFIGTAVCSYALNYYEEVGDTGRLRYINRQEQFFKSIDDNVKPFVFIREYYVEFGWHIAQRIKRISPLFNWSSNSVLGGRSSEVNIEDREKKFRKVLKTSSLVVIDHISTTWLETLAMGRPLIMVIDKEKDRIYSTEMPYFEMMAEVGIVHWSPVTAAKLVNEIVYNINEWWHDGRRQEIVKLIKERYIFSIDKKVDIEQWWYDALSKIIQ